MNTDQAGAYRASADWDVRAANEDQRTDAALALAALEALRRDPDVPPDCFSVDARNGVLTLHGTADTYYQRGAATRAVRFLPGVRDVRIHIKVARPIIAKDVKKRICDALHRSTSVDASRIQVEVSDGAITLSGTVRSAGERKDAVSAAASALGVSVVNDALQVVET